MNGDPCPDDDCTGTIELYDIGGSMHNPESLYRCDECEKEPTGCRYCGTPVYTPAIRFTYYVEPNVRGPPDDAVLVTTCDSEECTAEARETYNDVKSSSGRFPMLGNANVEI